MAFKMRQINIIIVILILNIFSGKVYAQNDKFTFIANDIDFKTTTLKNIKAVFRGKYSSWKNNQNVTIVLPSTKSENASDVAKYLYETTVTGMQKFWLSQVFQGRSNPPVFLENDSEIIEYVRKNPGSIGIVKANTPNIPSNIKINITG
jgi:ABC-type phosphate transport system substrate-binding protein